MAATQPGSQAAEPAIKDLKADHCMDRCWVGAAREPRWCSAAGFNIRRLLRAIVRLGPAGTFLAALTLLAHIGQQIFTALALIVGSPR